MDTLIIMDKKDLVRIANAIRLKQGHEDLLSVYQIFNSVEDDLYIIEDEFGNQLCATYMEQGVVADATEDDILLGKTAVTESGLVEGKKEVLEYNYAIINDDNCCYEVRNTTLNSDDMPNFITIPSVDNDYLEKYYNVSDEKWYLDDSFNTEWIPE